MPHHHNPPPGNPLASALKEQRNRHGLTQAQLADRLGVTQSAVAQWEAGSVTPTVARLRAIAHTLEVPTAELVELVQ